MEYICIGDIHGRIDLLEPLISDHSKNYIFTGDYVDRGLNSLEVIQTIMNLPNKICLMGNHDEMFLDAIFNYHLINNSYDRSFHIVDSIIYNHKETIFSFIKNTHCENKYYQVISLFHNDKSDLLVELLKECLRYIYLYYKDELLFLNNTFTYIESNQYVISHSGGNKNVLPKNQNLTDWLWERDNRQPINQKMYIYGHTPTHTKKVEINQLNVNIDTGAVFFDVPIGHYKINIDDEFKLFKLNT